MTTGFEDSDTPIKRSLFSDTVTVKVFCHASNTIITYTSDLHGGDLRFQEEVVDRPPKQYRPECSSIIDTSRPPTIKDFIGRKEITFFGRNYEIPDRILMRAHFKDETEVYRADRSAQQMDEDEEFLDDGFILEEPTSFEEP